MDNSAQLSLIFVECMFVGFVSVLDSAEVAVGSNCILDCGADAVGSVYTLDCAADV